MKIRSRGLGRRELEMNLREFTVERDGRGVLLKGVTHAPITWETTVRIGPRDIGGILRLALRPSMFRLALAWVLHREDRPGPAAEDRPGRDAARDRPDPDARERSVRLPPADPAGGRPSTVAERPALPGRPEPSPVAGAEGS